VAALLLGGDLIIVGDHADNAVEIRVADGNLVVQGRDASTTINGGARAVFEGVTRIADDLKVFLGRGSDVIDVRGIDIAGDVAIQADAFFARLGSGGDDDQVLLDLLNIGGSVNVSTGRGADAVLLERSSVAGDTTIETGAGDDRVSLVGLALGDSLALGAGGGADKAFLTAITVGGATRARLGGGDDEIIVHGFNAFSGRVVLDGQSGIDRAEIDVDLPFAAGQLNRRFETVERLAITEFSAEEGLAIRFIFLGDPPGTGSTVFSINGANFSGGEVAARAIGEFYASAPTAYVPGPEGATIAFDTPVRQVRFFFTHFPGDSPATATAFDAAGNVVAVAHSHEPTFIGDPGNFVTLKGAQPIVRVVIQGGMIDNVSFSR
jgi:hypothetical protein